MAQPSRSGIECRLPVRERADGASYTPDLAQNAFTAAMLAASLMSRLL
jgi:hypothetical protein